MTVYILKHSPEYYEPYAIIGVYSTLDLAEAAKQSHSDKMRETDFEEWNYGGMNWDIQEIEVDKINWL